MKQDLWYKKVQKFPRLSVLEVLKLLSKVSFVPVRQKGSHVILKKDTPQGVRTTVVPMHDEIDRGTLLEIIRQAGLTRDEFLKLAS